jgi:hypothetical protein
MANRADRRKKSKARDNVKIKNTEVASTLSIVIPIVLIFVFLIGGVFLFIYLEEGRRLPDEDYLRAEELVNQGALIGLTLEECAGLIGVFAILNDEGNQWTFITGDKAYKDGSGVRYYEIVVTHENDVAVSAVYRESVD